jgi:hypothetical protein
LVLRRHRSSSWISAEPEAFKGLLVLLCIKILIPLNIYLFQARFEDIRPLVLVLPQLVSLGFTKSFNGQIPYLLRDVLPNGLANLKSLEIKQDIADRYNCTLEGVLWYETLDGTFRTETNSKNLGRDFVTGYMHSIVRGAPNLQELALHVGRLNNSFTLTSASLVRARLLIRLPHHS